MAAVSFEPDPTPFDLRWRMLGTNVRVHPGFWIMSALLGWRWFEKGNFGYLLLWIVCVFFSILLHEFGHVMMGWCFGSRSQVLLYFFGGLAIGMEVWKRWQRVLVFFAGPAIQLVLLAVVMVLTLWLPGAVPRDYEVPVKALLAMLFLINLFWPLFNLLPIWPLDGGQITREVCEGIWGVRGFAYALLISGILAGVLAVHCLMAANGKPLIPYLDFLGTIWNAVLFAMLAVGSFQMWGQVNNQARHRPKTDDRLPWEQ